MDRRNIYLISGLSVASFDVIWGLVEAGSYFGIDWFRGTGSVGFALLVSVAINTALVIRWIFQDRNMQAKVLLTE